MKHHRLLPRLKTIFSALAIPIYPPARIALFFWALGLIALPFYTGRSGQPQRADYLFAATAVFLFPLTGLKLLPEFRVPLRWMARFLLYVVCVNAVWLLLTNHFSFAVFTSFYVFNALLLLLALVLASYAPESFLAVTFWCCAAALVLQVVLSRVSPGGEIRFLGTFNNPNQLAYYTLGVCTIVAVCAQRYRNVRVLLVPVLLCGVYLCYLSASRAGMAAVLLLITLMFVRRFEVLAAGVALVAAMLFGYELKDPHDRPPEPADLRQLWQRRIDEVRESDMPRYMGDRGLDRILKHPQHLLLGAGEGAFKRFHPAGKELHSSLASIMFCYGVPGTILFFQMLRAVARIAGLSFASFFVPMFLYGTFHHGLRFRIFWVSLAVILIVGVIESRQKQATQPRGVSPAR